jgi:hypothetical protein
MLCRLDLPGGVLLLRVGHVTFLVRVCLAARIVSRTIALLYIAKSIADDEEVLISAPDRHGKAVRSKGRRGNAGDDDGGGSLPDDLTRIRIDVEDRPGTIKTIPPRGDEDFLTAWRINKRMNERAARKGRAVDHLDGLGVEDENPPMPSDRDAFATWRISRTHRRCLANCITNHQSLRDEYRRLLFLKYKC